MNIITWLRYSYIKILLLSSLLCLTTNIFAQSNAEITKRINDGLKYYPSGRYSDAKRDISKCNLIVTYNFNYLENEDTQNRYNEPMLLEIGDDVVKFYGQNSTIRDSIINKFYTENKNNPTVGINAESWLPVNQTALYMDIYSYPQLLNREVYHRFDKYDYRYDEKIEQIEWEITGEQTEVLGYICLKAEAIYKGRKWYAYFTQDIPYNYGPWKLGGLPGLILKAEDEKGLFRWIAIGLNKPANRHIYKYDPKIKNQTTWAMLPQYVVKSVKKEDVDKLWIRQWLSPASMDFIFRGINKGTIKTRLPDGSVRNIVIDLNHDNNAYYPRFELE